MLGAIIGDIVGSRWEFNSTNDYNFEFFSDKNSFTDDTICTVAIADAILKGRDYGESLHDWCRRYLKPKGGFGGRFRKWVESDDPKPYGSYGNGSAMRVSPIGMYFRDSDEVIKQAELSAACTHNHPFGINGAKAIAYAVYLATKDGDGLKTPKKLKDDLLDICIVCCNDYGFASNIELDDYKNHFDETCQGTIPPAFDILYDSTSFEDAIRRAVSLGADADTLGAIVGSMAEHIWGIPEWMKAKAMSYLPEEMREVVRAFYDACEEKADYRPEDKKLRQQEMVMLWKLGYGHMGKYMNGEDPGPDKKKKASKDTWKTEDMPVDDISVLEMSFSLKDEEMAILRQGHIPEAQEDHWFMYCDDETIRYYRSWTGMAAFEAHYNYYEGAYHIDTLKINRQLCQFGLNGDIPGKSLFLYLIYSEVTGPSAKAWTAFFDSWKERVIKDMELHEEEEKRDKENYEAIDKVENIEAMEIRSVIAGNSPKRITPDKIDKLEDNEVFVFGSNKDGHHQGGAAKAAVKRFGAIWGQGDGFQGHSYAISTMEGLAETAKNVNRFIKFATEHKELGFYVTAIGCGTAGYNPLQIAPLFRKAIALPNILLPKVFWEYYIKTGDYNPGGFNFEGDWSKWEKM